MHVKKINFVQCAQENLQRDTFFVMGCVDINFVENAQQSYDKKKNKKY